MTEARDVRLGMYAHSNQPSHHIPWMYVAAGQPWKTQAITREILRRLYLGSEIGQGYPGDEDNGEMSAWYLFASLGLYPLRMGAPEYVIGSPLFERAEVALGKGKRLTVIARNNSPRNVYVQSLKVDGKPWPRAWIPHEVVARGATLEFRMGPEPSSWGSAPAELPPSLTADGSQPARLIDMVDSVHAEGGAQAGPVATLVDDDATTTVTLGAGVTLALSVDGDAAPGFYTLTSGDAPIRGAGWVLEGRGEGGDWQVLDERSGEDFAWAHQLRPFRIRQPRPWREYRLRLRGPAPMALAEVELLRPAP